MEQYDKIPIVVGVTGHRNIVEEDKPIIKGHIIESLKEIQSFCNGKNGENTPIIMLNAFAQGADMLCAEAAFELGLDVFAVLPCDKEKYSKSFYNEEDKNKLNDYLVKCKKQIIVPDTERNRAWFNMDDESYEYRQLGIYIAEHSHICIALWDGRPPKTEYGCGTVEVIKFALEHNHFDKEEPLKSGMVNDSAVIWIKSRRQGDELDAEIQKKWLICDHSDSQGEQCGDFLALDSMPDFLKDIISKTVDFNSEKVNISQDKNVLWKDAGELNGYQKSLQFFHIKSDKLSYGDNQRKYNIFMLLLAIIGTVVACAFLMYDDASLSFMIFPCTVAITFILVIVGIGRKKGYHNKYIEYRALAEALRIQFYISMCLAENPVITNVCDLYAWSQKIDMVWIEKTIQVLGVICESENKHVDINKVMDVWIGNNEEPMGQLKYHNKKKCQNKTRARKYEIASNITKAITIGIYLIIFAMEIGACILKKCNVDWFWENNIIDNFGWRSLAGIVLGVVACVSLLFSSYWGKLSFDRKVEDNEKMCKFYSVAFAKWEEVKKQDADVIKFVKEIARQEIVENGIWCSYVKENKFEINI